MISCHELAARPRSAFCQLPPAPPLIRQKSLPLPCPPYCNRVIRRNCPPINCCELPSGKGGLGHIRRQKRQFDDPRHGGSSHTLTLSELANVDLAQLELALPTVRTRTRSSH
jgi:hypothetical protein